MGWTDNAKWFSWKWTYRENEKKHKIKTVWDLRCASAEIHEKNLSTPFLLQLGAVYPQTNDWNHISRTVACLQDSDHNHAWCGNRVSYGIFIMSIPPPTPHINDVEIGYSWVHTVPGVSNLMFEGFFQQSVPLPHGIFSPVHCNVGSKQVFLQLT